MHNIRLLPYVLIDGIPTFKDSEIIQIYNWMKNDRTLETVFYNISKDKMSESFFLRFWKRKDLKMFVIFSENKVAGLIWLDRIIDSTAMIHINAFKWTWGGDNITLFKWATCEIFIKHNIDVLIGQMPVINKVAINFSKNVGFIKCGIIPKSLYVYRLNKKVDAYLGYATKDSFLQSMDKQDNTF